MAMRQTVRLGRFAGVPVGVHWSVLVILLLLGVRVKAITLWLLGGVSELDGQAPHARGDLLIALAGPLVSLAGAGLFAAAAVVASGWGAGSLGVAGLAWLAVVNAVQIAFGLY